MPLTARGTPNGVPTDCEIFGLPGLAISVSAAAGRWSRLGPHTVGQTGVRGARTVAMIAVAVITTAVPRDHAREDGDTRTSHGQGEHPRVSAASTRRDTVLAGTSLSVDVRVLTTLMRFLVDQRVNADTSHRISDLVRRCAGRRSSSRAARTHPVPGQRRFTVGVGLSVVSLLGHRWVFGRDARLEVITREGIAAKCVAL